MYQYDHTQGPACATACAAGTVVRNYFAFDGEGQRKDRQVNNLELVEKLLHNSKNHYFKVKNGYTDATANDLDRLNAELTQRPELAEKIKAALRIGVQQDTEVTGSHFGRDQYHGKQLLVTQVSGSAVSVAYSGQPVEKWRALASLVLDASYEATLYAAAENAQRHPEVPSARKVFLTALGGGVFGNDPAWIAAAMRKAFDKFKDVGLEVVYVSYGHFDPFYCDEVNLC